MRKLIVLRPEPGASATAARAQALGLDVVVAPLFATHAVAWRPPAPEIFDGVMMTSANAARLGGAALANYAHLPLYGVGAATAAAAQAAGFVDQHVGTGDAVALLRQIAADGKRRILAIGGRDRVPLPATPFSVTTVVVYASDIVAVPTLPIAGVALLHSARAATRFAAIAHDRAAFALVAISQAVAAAASGGWAEVRSAETPDDAAMLALAARLCKA